MPGLLETDTITAQNITTINQVGSFTATVAGFVSSQVRLSGLNGAAANITVRLIVNDSTNDFPGAVGTEAKTANADTRWSRDTVRVWLDIGDILKVSVLSSNSSDTSIAGSVRFLDAANPVDGVTLQDNAISAVKISSTALPASKFDTSNPVPVNVTQLAGSTTIDGLSLTNLLETILAFVAGETTVTDLGGGAKRIIMNKQNGSTEKLRIDFDSNGQWTATTVT